MYSFDWDREAGPVAGVPAAPAADFQAPQTMRVGVAQIMALDGDREGNFVRIEHAVVKAAADGADLVVFPETIILGWDNPLAWTEAHPIPGADTARLSALARANGVALVVGLAEKANATTLHDTAVLIDRTGELLHTHRKINILSTLMEHPYTPGPIDKANIASVPLRLASGAEVRVGVLICADTFLTPVLEAMAGAKPQLVAVPYGWSGCSAGRTNANASSCGEDLWPAHGRDLTQRVWLVANTTGAVAVGSDSVGQQIEGPWKGQTYGGFSTVAAPGVGGVQAVLADRDVEVRVVPVSLPR